MNIDPKVIALLGFGEAGSAIRPTRMVLMPPVYPQRPTANSETCDIRKEGN